MTDTQKREGYDPLSQQLSQHGLTVNPSEVDSDAALTAVTRESPTIGPDSPSYCSTGSHDLHTGEVISFDDLYSRYHGMVYRRALNLTGSQEDAEDAVQVTFVKAWKALSRTRPDYHWASWLYCIVNHVCNDMYRAARRRPASFPLEVIEETDAECVLMEAPSEQTALAVFGRLTAEQQRLCLVKAEGISHAELAAEYGLTLVQLRWRLYQARDAYRRALAREEAA